MGDYTTIGAVSKTLRDLLQEEITNSTDPHIKSVAIHLLSPKEMQAAGDTVGVSVWLYKVSRMAEMLNDPPQRKKADQVAHLALPLLLYYLITPMTTHPETRHVLLGKVLQVFNDHAILRGADLKGSLQGTTEQLRINLEALTLEELSLVWYALGEPYQLSITYLIQVVKIHSDLEPVHSSPVLKKEMAYEQILAVN
jgi:hypothetical protein